MASICRAMPPPFPRAAQLQHELPYRTDLRGGSGSQGTPAAGGGFGPVFGPAAGCGGLLWSGAGGVGGGLIHLLPGLIHLLPCLIHLLLHFEQVQQEVFEWAD